MTAQDLEIVLDMENANNLNVYVIQVGLVKIVRTKDV